MTPDSPAPSPAERESLAALARFCARHPEFERVEALIGAARVVVDRGGLRRCSVSGQYELDRLPLEAHR